MIRLTLVGFAIWALAAPAAMAQSTTVSPAVVQAAPTPNRAKDRPDEVVCKRLPISGTRVLGPKTCMARRDWKSMEGRGMEDVEAAIRASRTRNCAGC